MNYNRQTNLQAKIYAEYILGKTSLNTASKLRITQLYVMKTFAKFDAVEIPRVDRIKQAKNIEAELFRAIENKMSSAFIDVLQGVYSKFLAV